MPPDDRFTDKFETTAYTEEVTVGNFIEKSGGLGYKFGQIFDPLSPTHSHSGTTILDLKTTGFMETTMSMLDSMIQHLTCNMSLPTLSLSKEQAN